MGKVGGVVDQLEGIVGQRLEFIEPGAFLEDVDELLQQGKQDSLARGLDVDVLLGPQGLPILGERDLVLKGQSLVSAFV